MKHSSRPRILLIYGLLVVGSAIFSLPFVWMVATSVKVDRELFTPKLHIFPMAPLPATTSPYLDLREFRDLSGPKIKASLDILREHLSMTGALASPTGQLANASEAAALGIYARLRRTRPAAFWESSDLAANLRREVTPESAAEGMRPALRELGLGTMRFASLDGQEVLSPRDVPAKERFQIAIPGGETKARFTDPTDALFPGATLHYEFSGGDRIILWQKISVPFDPARFSSATLAIQPDDSWHRLTAYFRVGNQWFEAQQPFYLAFTGNSTTDLTWRIPSASDTSGEVKTWTQLRPIKVPPRSIAGLAGTDETKIDIFLVIDQSSAASAWLGKLMRNYRLTFSALPFWRYFCTSIFVVALNILFAMFSCSLAAYAFSRLAWPGRDTLFAVLLATMMVPAQVTMIPQFMIFKSLGWYNTLTPLWITALFANAFYVFLMRQFMKSIPRELEEAAKIDGCGFWRLYFDVVLPLVKPALATIAIFTFLASWNDFMTPLIYLNDERLYTLSLGLFSFKVGVGSTGDQALLMAASFLTLMPVILLFFFAQRYFIQGVTITGMK